MPERPERPERHERHERPDTGVEVHRIYDDLRADADAGPGTYRVLVDRLWPRGVRKADAALDRWARDVAPSPELRQWYGHDPARFEEFARRYREELRRPPAAPAVTELRATARERQVVLVTATRDVAHSGAQVLYDHLVSP
jgi:uncharacterized protein YeaO (DUF488 family)